MKLGDICRFQSGGTPPKGEPSFFNGNIPWVTTVALNGSTIDESNAVDWITEKAIEKSAAKIVPANSVMVGTRVGVGKVAINKIPMSTSQDIISLLDIDENKWSKAFICKFILGKGTYLNSQARGATIKGIKIETLAGLHLPDIPIEQQCKIATVIDAADNLIALRKEQLAKLDQLVKSRFIELLQPYFDNGQTTPLIKLVCEDRPITYGILKPGTNYVGGYPVIRVKDFSRGLVNVEEVLHTTPEIYNKYLRSVLVEGDIIISIGGTIGRIAVIPKEFVGANITQHTARISLKDKRYLLYFRGLLESDIMQRWMKERVLGVAQPSINLGDVKQMPIPIVDECVMNELNAFVEQTDKSKLAIQQSLDKLELLKKALMQEYFG